MGVVSTNPARCQDCYRCVRTCPVKAALTAGRKVIASVAPSAPAYFEMTSFAQME